MAEQAERLPTDPATRRQGAATARLAVAARGFTCEVTEIDERGASVGEIECWRGSEGGRRRSRWRARTWSASIRRRSCGACVAVVTGGSGAIGRAISLRLALSGAEVHVLGRSTARLDAVVAEIREHGGTAHVAHVDLEDDEAVHGSSPPCRQWTSS